MADLLAAALEYAAAGVHVFPARVSVHDGYKTVAPVGRWRHASTTDPTTIRSWFAPGRPWAEASLCIDCGKSELVVVDLDEGNGKQGVVTWTALVAEFDLPVTAARARTPSGGEHWYYRENRRRVVGIDSSGKVAHGVDIRGLGGFVIAWPSEDTRGAYGQVDLEALAEAPVIPDLVVDRVQTREAATVPTADEPQAASAPRAQDEFWSEWTIKPHTREQAKAFCQPPLDTFRALRTPEDGGFNDRLNSLACIWSHFIPAFMTAEQAEAEIYAAAVANHSVEWQGEYAVRATIRSGLAQRSDPWKAVRVDAATDSSVEPVSDLEREVARQRLTRDARRHLDAEDRPQFRRPEVLTLRERLARPLPPAAYRIEGWQPVGSRVVLAAQFKAGKTTMTGNLARSLLDGDPWLDQFQVTPIDGTLGILDFEMSASQMDQWLGAQGIRNDDRVIPIPMRGNALAFDILDPARRTEWADELRRLGCQYLMLDCLRPVLDAIGLDEHRDAGRFLVAFDALLSEAEVAEATVVHHMGHTGERSRGDSRIRDWPDVEWRLVRQDAEDPASPRYVSAFGRDVDQEEAQLVFDEMNRHLTLIGGNRRDVAARVALNAVLSIVDESPGMSGRQIEAALSETDHSQKAVRAALKIGVRDRFLVFQRGARNSFLYSSASVRQSASVVRQRTGVECVSASIDNALTHTHQTQPSALPDEDLDTDRTERYR